MAEIQTNPSHVAEFPDINLGDVEILDEASGLKAQIDLFGAIRRLRVEAIIGGGGGLGVDVRNADADDDFAEALLGLVTNARLSIRGATNFEIWNGGTDNAAAIASPAGAFIAGVVTDPLDVFVDGDVSLLHFDLSGRLLVNEAGITDTDDNAIASGQTTGMEIMLPYMFNGTEWIRNEGGVDNAAAPASPQGLFVGGVVTDPVDVFADGDVSLLHFDTSGRLRVNSENLEETDDDSIPIGNLHGVTIPLNYFSNLDNGSIWERWTGRDDDDAIPVGDTSPTVIALEYGFDGVDWARKTVSAAGAASVSITENVQIQNIETTAALGASATFTATTRDMINHESYSISVIITRSAVDTDVDVIVENSSDGGAVFREVDTINLAVTAANPTETLNRVYSVTRQDYRVRLVNNTANALSVTELITMQKPVA